MASTSESFEQLAPRIIQQLRSSLSAVIEAASSAGPIRKATDLERSLKLPTTLAWKVFTVAQAEAPLANVGNIPGPEAMNRFFAAAARHGVPDHLLVAARSAFAAFEDLVKVHAETRAALDSMISGLGHEGSNRIDLQHKRAAFKAYSHIWGVQARTQLSCFIFRPSRGDPSRLDFIGIRGLIGLWRLRRDVSWVISSARVSDDDGRIRRPATIRPIDEPDPQSPGVSVLREFCSHPIPEFRSVPTESGFINTLLEPTTIGARSEVTCLLADTACEAMARYRDEHNQEHGTQSYVRTPSGVLIHDVMFPPGTFAPTEPRVFVYGDQRGVDPAAPGRECDLLALRESVVHLGRGVAVLRTPDVPRYPEMVRYAFERTGWDGDQFDVYRCRVEYPVMPSSVVVQFDLLDGP